MQTGTIMLVVLVVLVVLLAALTSASLYRFAMLRRGGTSALLRVLPADGGHGWRHGLIRYGEEELVFFKLTSLRLGPERSLLRPAAAWQFALGFGGGTGSRLPAWPSPGSIPAGFSIYGPLAPDSKTISKPHCSVAGHAFS